MCIRDRIISERWDISAHIKEAVLHHHENVDGSGYPDGLEGAQQTMFTRILHVADVYDALTSRRPYKMCIRDRMYSIRNR